MATQTITDGVGLGAQFTPAPVASAGVGFGAQFTTSGSSAAAKQGVGFGASFTSDSGELANGRYRH